jgi:hypothetical protein
VDSKTLELLEPEPSRQLGGVAQLEVAVQWKVVGDQRDAVLDQQLDPVFERADEARRL